MKTKKYNSFDPNTWSSYKMRAQLNESYRFHKRKEKLLEFIEKVYESNLEEIEKMKENFDLLYRKIRQAEMSEAAIREVEVEKVARLTYKLKCSITKKAAKMNKYIMWIKKRYIGVCNHEATIYEKYERRSWKRKQERERKKNE